MVPVQAIVISCDCKIARQVRATFVRLGKRIAITSGNCVLHPARIGQLDIRTEIAYRNSTTGIAPEDRSPEPKGRRASCVPAAIAGHPSFLESTMPADDGLMCVGASAIAKFTGASRRQVYHWTETGLMPAFKIGSVVCADKAALRAWLAERASAASRKVPA